MDQFKYFFSHLIDTADFPARWHCGKWSDFHGWLYIISDLGIWLAYFLIPVVLIVFLNKKKDIPFLSIFWLFGAFIIFCGTTHFLDAIIFWYPIYRVQALVKFLTAIISFVTLFAMIKALPQALKLQGRDYTLKIESEKEKVEIQNETLQKELDSMMRLLGEREKKIAELKNELDNR